MIPQPIIALIEIADATGGAEPREERQVTQIPHRRLTRENASRSALPRAA